MAFSPERPRVPEKGDDEDSRKKRLLEKIRSSPAKEFIKAHADIPYEEIIPELLKEDIGWRDYLVENFAVFTEGIDSSGRKKIILKMIEGYVSRFWFVERYLHNLTSFDPHDRKEIMHKMFREGDYYDIDFAVNCFSNLTDDFNLGDCEDMAIALFGELIEKKKGSSHSGINHDFSKKLTFKGIDSDSRKRIVLALTKRSRSVAYFILESFFWFTDNVDQDGRKEVILALIKALGHYYLVERRNSGIKKFIASLGPDDRKDIMHTIFSIENDSSDPEQAVMDFAAIRDFSVLTEGLSPGDREDMAFKLIERIPEKGKRSSKYVSIEIFTDYLPDLTRDTDSHGRENIVIKFIEKGWVLEVMECFSAFVNGIDSSGRRRIVFEIGKFLGESLSDTRESCLKYFVKNFPTLVDGIDSDDYKKIIFDFIGTKMFEEILRYHSFDAIFTNFKEEDHEEVALMFIGKREGVHVGDYFSMFTGIKEKDHEDFLLNVIALGEAGHNFVTGYIRMFTGIGFADVEDQRNLVFKIIALGEEGCIFFIKNFSWLAPSDFNHSDVILEVTKMGEGRVAAQYLDNFTDLNKHAAFRLLEMGDEEVSESVIKNITRFSSEYRNDIVLKLIEEGEGWLVVEHVSEIDILDDNLDCETLVQQLIEHDQAWVVAWFWKELNVLTSFSDEDCKKAFIYAKKREVDDFSQVEDDTFTSFEQAAEIFGWKNMLEYCRDREDVNFYEAVNALGKVVELYKLSQLSSEMFFKNILSQVQGDTLEYGVLYNDDYDEHDRYVEDEEDEYDGGYNKELTAYHHLNSIAWTMNTDIEGTLARLKKHTSIEQLQELLHVMQDPRDVFASWDNLKRYQNLSDLLENSEALEKLKELKKSDPALCEYVSTLVFHPDSKINVRGVIPLLEDPKRFLTYIIERISLFPSINHSDLALKLIEKGEGLLVANNKFRLNNLNYEILVQQLIEHDQKWIAVWFSKEFGVTIPLSNEDCREAFTRAREQVGELRDKTINEQFEQAAETFGWKNMFRYRDREDVSFHDLAHALDEIVRLHAISELSPQEFFNNILNQVQRDTSEYNNNEENEQVRETSYDHLNTIAQTMSSDIEGTLAQLRKHTNIERLQELLHVMQGPKDVFASWDNLKRYQDLSSLLEKMDVLDKLEEIKESNPDLYTYVDTLAFHKDSKINMKKVILFLQNPKAFLSMGDTHTPEEVQERKKPINYTRIPYLDLSAEELRDALVDGTLDKITTFPPMRVQYTVPFTREALSSALGKREVKERDGVPGREKIPGKANNPEILFKRVKGPLANELIRASIDGTTKILEEDAEKINTLARDLGRGAVTTALYRKQDNTEEVERQIETITHLLGNQENAKNYLKGNLPIPEETEKEVSTSMQLIGGEIIKDTINGTDKKNKQKVDKLAKSLGNQSVQTYLNGTLTISKEVEKQIEAMIYDKSIGMQRKTTTYIAEITEKKDPVGAITGNDTTNCMPYGSGKNTVYTFNPNTAQFVIRAVKEDGTERTIAQSVLTKDIDIKKSAPAIIKKLRKEEHLETILPEEILATAETYLTCDNIEVAKNFKNKDHLEPVYRAFFTEYLAYLKENNHNINTGKVPIGTAYSDALTDLLTELNTFIQQALIGYSDKEGKKVYILNLPENKEEAKPKPKQGINPLTYEDSIKVGYLESKAYNNAPNLIESLSAMQNTLTAKDINNAIKDRPNLSFSYTDEDNHMRGYILAYEGVLNNTGTAYDNKPCIHIADLATDKQSKQAGRTLIKTFINHYQEHYVNTKNPLPIYAEIPDTTSLKLTVRQLDTISKRLNISFELVTLPTYEQGGSTMHPVMIVPREG